MADALIYLSDEIFQATEFEMLISTSDLAELTGMSRDSAVKILREFKDENIIRIQSGILHILEPQSLVKISNFG